MAAGLRVPLALVLALAMLGSADARKPRPVPCGPGAFALAPASVAQVSIGLGIAVDGVELTGDRRVRVGGCTATVRTKATARATRVTATFARCGAARRLRLAGTIASPACDEMLGTLRVASRSKQRFTARRVLPSPPVPGGQPSTTVVTVAVTTTSSVPPTTLPPSSCGDAILDAGEECDHDPQCGRRAHCTPRCRCEPLTGDVAPTTQVLIDDALRGGRIDLGTALLYRAYAIFADPRLPAEFDGAGTEPEDTLLLSDVAAAWPALAAAARAALEPFTVRPTDPRSVFSTGYAPPTPGRGAPRVEPMSCTTVAPCAVWNASDTTHFRVWSCGDALAGPRAAVASEIESLYAPMTRYMGEPVPDEGDNDGTPKTDVYIVTPNQARLRDGECRTIASGASGQAHPAPPRLSTVGSGTRITAAFILLPVDELSSPTRKSTLAHEFFHVLQLSTSEPATYSWLAESTATWAEWRFVPETTDVAVHPRFRTYQARLFLSLDTNHLLGRFSEAYAAYIWWYFAQQDSDPNVVAAVWFHAANGAAPNDAANRAFAFADHYRDFIVRNLDDFPLTGGRQRTYQDAPMDPKFPFPQKVADIEPVGLVTTTSFAGLTASTSLEYLTQQVFRVDVAEDVRELTFDFSKLPGGSQLDVEVLLRTTKPTDPALGLWTRRRPAGRKLRLCRDEGDPQVFEALVVLGNHDWRGGAKISGPWTVTGRVACCQPGRACWQGTSSHDTSRTVEFPGGIGSGTIRYHAEASVLWLPVPQDPSGSLFQPQGTMRVSGYEGTFGPCTFSAAPVTLPLRPELGQLQFFPGTPLRYFGVGSAPPEASALLQVLLVCPEGGGVLPAEVPAWFETGELRAVDPMAPNTIAGGFSSEGHTYAWRFDRVN